MIFSAAAPYLVIHVLVSVLWRRIWLLKHSQP